jgi:hypothetical protein
METEKAATAPTVEQQRLVRPSTRGELAERLKAGESCEVAGYVAEMTLIMLRGWLGVENFTVTPSENPGWVIYRPNVRICDDGGQSA